ncbi:MAG: cation transporter [Bacteroidales bacterium]|nr:cation transporter [Bacteroidales bacterium]
MHNHSHNYTIDLNKAFTIGIVLNIVFVIVEFIAGIWSQSMGLLSDAGHNLSDVVSLILSMLAFRLTKSVSSKKFTYGYRKSTILVSLINAIILLVAVGIIIVKSIEKFFNPQHIQGETIAWVAGIGILINAFTALLFFKEKDKDLNIKSAYLHMLADALVSLGVVISGILIYFTQWYIIDAIVGIIIAVIIIISTWGLLIESIRLSLDGVPHAMDIDKISNEILSEKHVLSIHHLHIWALSTTQNALTVHVVIDDIHRMESVKASIKQKLANLGIQHATLEIEDCKSTCTQDCL